MTQKELEILIKEGSKNLFMGTGTISERQAFEEGAKSDESKEYWLEYFTREQEAKEDPENLSMIEIVASTITSEAAKEYHTKGMYTEEDMTDFAEYCYLNGDDGLSFKESLEEWK